MPNPAPGPPPHHDGLRHARREAGDMKRLRCGRDSLEAAELAEQADTLREAVSGIVTLALAGPHLTAAYGGVPKLSRAFEKRVLRAEEISFEHARAMACIAGTCGFPIANEPAPRWPRATRGR